MELYPASALIVAIGESPAVFVLARFVGPFCHITGPNGNLQPT